MRAPRFNPKAIGFLRGLKRHNNREWFNARKAQYEELVRAPMLEIVERLAVDFQKFAPELAAGPRSRFRSIVESPAFRRKVGTLEGGQKLQRVPRGFPPDHPAAEYLRCRMFVAG